MYAVVFSLCTRIDSDLQIRKSRFLRIVNKDDRREFQVYHFGFGTLEIAWQALIVWRNSNVSEMEQYNTYMCIWVYSGYIYSEYTIYNIIEYNYRSLITTRV